ncbi:MAG: GAF domain-containing protein [Chloroflexi bacterium]|nr:GAF domain-containing protein [Chloroflexota bacterium]
MKDKTKTKEQLIAELAEIRQRISGLEAAETERVQAEESLRRRADELAALQATVLDITTPHDLPTLLQTIVERAARLLNAVGGGLYLCDPSREEARCVVSYNTPRDFTGIVLKYGEGAAGTVAQTGESLIIDDYRTWSARAGVYEEGQPFTSVLSVPMIWQGQVTGVIHVLHNVERRRFSQADLGLLALFANHAAIAVENIRLYEQAQRDITERKQAEQALRQRTAQLEALREVGLELIFQLDLDALLLSIVSRATELLEAASGGLYLYRPEQDVLEWVVSIGPHAAPVGITLQRGEGLSGKVWESGEPLIVDDYQHWEGRSSAWEDHPPVKTVMAVPVRWGEQFLGVLNVVANTPGSFSEADAELLGLFATQAAIAIRNARLLQAEQGQRELAEALEEAAAAVSSTLDLDEVLDRILGQVERVVPGDVFNIMRIEGDLTRTVRWRGQERFGAEEFVSIVAFRVADVPTFRQMVETGKSVIIPDTGADPDWVVQPELAWLRSYVAAPIQVGGTTVGFLNVDGTRPGQFGPADARRLEAFASHAAAAIENAQLYQALRAHAGQLEQRVEERTAELKAQYAWLDAILRSATDGIVVTDEEGSIVRANPVAQEWLAQTLSPEEAGRLRETIRSLVTRAEEQPVEFLELTGLDLELSGALVVEEGVEKPTAVVIDIHDVSHLKALDRMKTRFITNISHELRTPITTIKLYAHLMNQYPEKWKGYLDVLAREADHQAQLVEGILQISSIDAGRIEMEPRPTPLDELAGATVASHRILAQERGLTLKLQPVPPSIPSLVGEKVIALVDPERMVQVLNNLVENAIRYTPEGGSVLVSTGVGEADGRAWATVTVTDTGMGIPEDEMSHIFDRFFRGEEPRAMQLTGAGLGLAIAKEIVELHGGRVTVESQAGEGSTFTVWLPLSDRG